MATYLYDGINVITNTDPIPTDYEGANAVRYSQAADLIVNNSETPVDTDLSFTGEANTSYLVMAAFKEVKAGTTNGEIRFAALPVGAEATGAFSIIGSGPIQAIEDVGFTMNTGIMHFVGMVNFGATAGEFKFQYAQATAEVANNTLKANQTFMSVIKQ